MESVGVERRASRSGIRGFVARALVDLALHDAIGVVTVPVPVVPLSLFLGLMPRDRSFLWNNPPSGMDCAGGGVAEHISVKGPDRFSQVRSQSEALWDRVRVVHHPDAPAYRPRLFGGLAFIAGGGQQPPWQEFGDGAFSLSRWTYGRKGCEAFLSLAVSREGRTGSTWRSDTLEELDEILDTLYSQPEPAAVASGALSDASGVKISQYPIELWRGYIEKVLEAINSGAFFKLVAARRSDVTLPFAPSDLAVMGRLMTEPKCAHFAFRRAHTSFVGASPELLFLKTGLELRTQALAGTARAAGPAAPSRALHGLRLLESTKDRSEHDFVVTAIRDALTPLCDEVTVSANPEVLKLRNMLHINTPFEARVRRDTHVTELLAALHPTPAVGGVPGHAAQVWISRHEQAERGWYTGPVGWFDSGGDAEFAVAIRCGVLAGSMAHLYTGAGVVSDSNYESEYEETSLKQIPMLRALGLDRG